MILDRATFWYRHQFLWRELRYKSHDADIGAGLLHSPHGFRIPQRAELMDLQALFLRGQPQRIRPGAFLLGGAEHSSGLVAASKKRFQHRFAEILLADDRNSHFASAPAGFGGREKAPACFLASISASLKPSTSFRIS